MCASAQSLFLTVQLAAHRLPIAQNNNIVDMVNNMMDQWGHHGLACKKSRGRQGRHSALNESIQRALRSAKVASVLEPPGLDRGYNKRPDGLTVYPWKYGKSGTSRS